MKLKFKNGGTIKLQPGGKTYNHNDYYGYINKIQEKAISNPQWFWSDSEDASQARQWLYDNGASAVVDNIYENTPENIQKNISYKKLSNTSGTKKITSDIHSAQKNFMDTAGAVGLQSIAPVGLAVGLTVAPEVTIPALIGGAGGMKATDYAINKLSNDKYNTWGEFIRGDKDLGQTGNLLAEFTNPGGWIGGGGATAIVRRSAPMMIRSMQDQVWKLNKDGSFVYDIPGGAKARLNSMEPVKWRWAKDGSYDKGTIKTPLFARKSQIAHELGHHAAGQDEQILGAYTPGYQYAEGVSPERNYAENFADLFKTRLGYRYKGKNANLRARQEAIDSGDSKVFDHLSNPGNHREVYQTLDRPESWMMDWTRDGTDDSIIKSYLDVASRFGRVESRDPGYFGVPIYEQRVRPGAALDPSIQELGTKVTHIMDDGFDYTKVYTPEYMRSMLQHISKHPFVQRFQGITVRPRSIRNPHGDTSNLEVMPIIRTPYDIGHMFWRATHSPIYDTEAGLTAKFLDRELGINPNQIVSELKGYIPRDKLNEVISDHATPTSDGRVIADNQLMKSLAELYHRYNGYDESGAFEQELLNNEVLGQNAIRGSRMVQPVFDKNLAESRIVETNKSADSEKIMLNTGAEYGIIVDDAGRKIIKPRNNVEVIPVTQFHRNPITGKIELRAVRNLGNDLHRNELIYRDGKFIWGPFGEHSLVAPLTEGNYQDAYNLYVKSVLDPINKRILKINKRQGTKIAPATIKDEEYMPFDVFENIRKVKPYIERDLTYLKYNTVPE